MVYFSIWASKTLQKSSAIQKISVTLSSVIIAIIVCKLLIFSTLKLQQFSLITKFLDSYISSNSRYFTAESKGLMSSNYTKSNTTSETLIEFNVEKSMLFSFKYLVSSEQKYDVFTITLDGKKLEGISGTSQNEYNLKSASNLNGNLNCSKELEHYAS